MAIALLWTAQVLAFVIGLVGPWRDPPEQHTNGRVARPIRLLLSLSLVLTACLVWNDSTLGYRPYARWVCYGMSASFVGDLIMARIIPVPSRLIGGMAAFAVAHALYIVAYVQTVPLCGYTLPTAGLWMGLIAYGAVTRIGWSRYIRNPEKPAALNTGALAYGGWIAVMASFALALAAACGGAWWLTALGGVVFIASDFLIGVTEIGGRRWANANDWIWATYLAGQMGIVYASWVAMQIAQ